MKLPRAAVRVIARGKPLVPRSAWPLLNFAASVRGSAPLQALPRFRRVVVACAHPDDELACAGTLANLAAIGADIEVVYATAGEGTLGSPYSPSETGARRRSEAEKVCSMLGVRRSTFLGFADGSLAAELAQLTDRLGAIIKDRAPEVVFVPWFLDGHADHRAMSKAVANADGGIPFEIWGYEWWTALVPNRLVDITSVWPKKEAAAKLHVTAAMAFDVGAGGLGLNRWRSIYGLHGVGYAEAFIAASQLEYRDLVDRFSASHD